MLTESAHENLTGGKAPLLARWVAISPLVTKYNRAMKWSVVAKF